MSSERVRVLVRADATAVVGVGHVARCLTLARQLQARGAKVSFAGAAMPESLAADVRLAGFEAHTLASGTSPIRSQQDDAADVLALLAEFGGADVVIVDHYDLDADWERAVSASGPRIAVIDDSRIGGMIAPFSSTRTSMTMPTLATSAWSRRVAGCFWGHVGRCCGVSS